LVLVFRLGAISTNAMERIVRSFVDSTERHGRPRVTMELWDTYLIQSVKYASILFGIGYVVGSGLLRAKGCNSDNDDECRYNYATEYFGTVHVLVLLSLLEDRCEAMKNDGVKNAIEDDERQFRVTLSS
jgi:hypothetical protein